MNKLLLVVVLLLSGCSGQGYEIICSANGKLFRQYQSELPNHADPLDNRRQVCYNQPDGSILIKTIE